MVITEMPKLKMTYNNNFYYEEIYTLNICAALCIKLFGTG